MGGGLRAARADHRACVQARRDGAVGFGVWSLAAAALLLLHYLQSGPAPLRHRLVGLHLPPRRIHRRHAHPVEGLEPERARLGWRSTVRPARPVLGHGRRPDDLGPSHRRGLARRTLLITHPDPDGEGYLALVTPPALATASSGPPSASKPSPVGPQRQHRPPQQRSERPSQVTPPHDRVVPESVDPHGRSRQGARRPRPFAAHRRAAQAHRKGLRVRAGAALRSLPAHCLPSPEGAAPGLPGRLRAPGGCGPTTTSSPTPSNELSAWLSWHCRRAGQLAEGA